MKPAKLVLRTVSITEWLNGLITAKPQ